MHRKPVVFAFLSFILVLGVACSLSSAVAPAAPPNTPVPPTAQPAAQGQPVTEAPPQEAGAEVPATAGSPTPPPLVATIMASQHAMKPSDTVPAGGLHYDVDSSGTAADNRAPYGDSYNINLFERPFTETVMNYLPALDITTFTLSQDNDWYYVSFDLIGGDMNDPMGINYAVELDTNHDGFGDALVWAYPPYSTTWIAETVRVYTDTNHDTGGLSAEKSDAPLKGDGYETVIFDRGQGSDTDLAWVRLNPQAASAVQIAFKRTLAGNAFMWGVWADAGIRDPGKFNYNDRFTEAEAGSPQKEEQYYPIKAISQVDNTCWLPVGFKPTGEEPHLCPGNEPPAPKHKPGPTPVSCGPNLLYCIPWIIQFPTPIPPPR